MTIFAGKYRIESTRLKDWDYSLPGYYFVIICTRNFQPYFGNVVDGRVELSAAGEIANKFWQEIPSHFPHVVLDKFVIMPNHMHGIIVITSQPVETQHAASLQKPVAGSLSVVIRSYKSAVTRWFRRNGCPSFAWQPRFYDHIIRNDESLHEIRKYILANPLKWEYDRDNPKNIQGTEI